MKYELNTLYNMDCMEAMKYIPDKYFDLAIVDPPYGIGLNHNIGRRKGQRHSPYKKADWDNEPPTERYFNELFRISRNQIIFGANHFISKFAKDSAGWIVWDKMISEKTTFSMGELIWTSFDRLLKIYTVSNTGGANTEEKIVPSQKPVELYKLILRDYAAAGMKLVDTHAGSGTSMIACYDMGIDCIAFEKDQNTFTQAFLRVENHKRQAVFEEVRQLGL